MLLDGAEEDRDGVLMLLRLGETLDGLLLLEGVVVLFMEGLLVLVRGASYDLVGVLPLWMVLLWGVVLVREGVVVPLSYSLFGLC